MAAKSLTERMAEIVRAESDVDRQAKKVRTVPELIAILKDGNELMNAVLELAGEKVTPEERAAAERYARTVAQPTAAVVRQELRDILDKHGVRAMLRAAGAVSRDLLAELDEKSPPKRESSN
jgi:hypothetical protein